MTARSRGAPGPPSGAISVAAASGATIFGAAVRFAAAGFFGAAVRFAAAGFFGAAVRFAAAGFFGAAVRFAAAGFFGTAGFLPSDDSAVSTGGEIIAIRSP